MWTGGVGTWGLDKTRGDFVAALTALLGEYATKLDQEAVLAADKNRGRGATPELVVLIGRRFVYVDELEEGRQLDEARVKALTGSERLALGRRSTIVGLPPSAVANFAKSLIVGARRGFSDAARRSIGSRG